VRFGAAAKTVVVGLGAAGVRLYETTTGKEVTRLPNQAGRPETIVLSGDGKILASVTAASPGASAVPQERKIHLWDACTGKPLRELRLPKKSIGGSLALSPDARVVLWWDEFGMRRWDLRTGIVTTPDFIGEHNPGQLSLSPDTRLLLTSRAGMIRLWDLASGKLVLFRQGPRRATFNPEGSTLAIGTPQGVTLWDVGGGKVIRSWKQLGGVSVIAFSPDGRQLATVADGGLIRVCSTTTGRELVARAGHQGRITSLRFSRDGLALGSWSMADGSARIWSLPGGKTRFHYQTPENEGPLDLDVDRAVVATGGRDSEWVTVVDLRSRKPLRRFEDVASSDTPQTVAFSPGSTSLASLRGYWPSGLLGSYPPRFASYRLDLNDYWTGTARVMASWSARPGTSAEYRGPDGRLLQFSPDGRVLAGTAWDTRTGAGFIWLWDGRSGRPLPQVPRDAVQGRLLTFSADGQFLAAGGSVSGEPPDRRDDKVSVWELGTGKPLLRVPDRRREVRALCLSGDGRFVMLGTSRGAIKLWDLLTGREVGRLPGHRGAVCSLALSPGGHLGSGSEDTTILVWDLEKTLAKWRCPASLKNPELRALRTALTGDDALKANRAVWRLALAPDQALPWLRKHLRPASAPDARVALLVRDLGSADYQTRENATRQLAALGEKAEDALRAAVLRGGDLEARRRAERLLRPLAGRTLPAAQRRCLALLEQIGSAEAREQLRQLAKGAPGARLTLEAQAALERLARRGRFKAAP
jgi:WD40 repeat protein